MLVYQAPWSDDARERLKAMAASQDGFVIAEKDLQIRGPGDFFGTRQSGLPQLRAGNLTRDADLLELAFTEARARVEHARLTPAAAGLRPRRVAAAVRVDHRRLTMRIIAGAHKGRTLKTPTWDGAPAHLGPAA